MLTDQLAERDSSRHTASAPAAQGQPRHPGQPWPPGQEIVRAAGVTSAGVTAARQQQPERSLTDLGRAEGELGRGAGVGWGEVGGWEVGRGCAGGREAGACRG